MQKEKIRVYILARELNVDTKILLDMCKQAGFDVKNQLSSLDHDQQAALEQLVKQGSKPAPPKPVAPVRPPISIDDRKVATLPASRPRKEEVAVETPSPAPAPLAEVVPPSPAPAPVAELPVSDPEQTEAPMAPVSVAKPAAPASGPKPMRDLSSRPARPAASTSPTPAKPVTPPPAPAATPTPPPIAATTNPVVAPPAPTPPSVATTPPASTVPTSPPSTGRPGAPAQGRVPSLPSSGGSKSPQDLGRTPPSGGAGGGGNRPPGPRRTPSPTFGHLRPIAPPSLKPQKPSTGPTTTHASGEKVLKPIKTFTKDQIRDATTAKPLRPDDLLNPPTNIPVVEVPADIDDDDDKPGGKKKPTAIPGRDKRHAERNRRADARKKTATSAVVLEHGKVHDLSEDAAGARRRRDRHAHMRHKPAGPVKRDKIELAPPITVRNLSEALGVKQGELLFKLMAQGAAPNISINSTIENNVAEIVALEYGSELTIKQSANSEQTLLHESVQPDIESDLMPRAPIVTVMGHVDHGKTSLLDKIRRSNVVDTEAGGITQVIRAWRVEHHGKPITFLDTPGHEAFTKMRARGAQVTDIAVIVVAADDGVMPQTEEAIHHAKAAGVSLVVAINKIDMPQANLNRTRQQLYGLDVLPDNMGGDTPFIETSAATGKGIDELLEAISVVAELKELRANPNRPAQGTVLEAMLSEGEGVQATLLVRNGTLRRGDIILCGAAYGRVRQMYDDFGRPLQEAGPSMPVRITGLDVVPDADDPFVVLDDLQKARELGEQRQSRRDASHLKQRAPITLESLAEAKITELKVILKADFRGSIEAIRKEMEKLHHEEVRVKVLEAGIGGITETDVWLALASPEDTMIVGFNAVPDERARALADEKGIQIREYNIIYNLTNDVRAALEGKLKPKEEIVHLGRAVVRETFKNSRVGTIAGCYITQGIIRRNAKVRVIREGVVIYPPADRTVGLESLKRYKEDVAEVREGFECGLKVAAYDDIKVGDVVEAYRIEQVQRTL